MYKIVLVICMAFILASCAAIRNLPEGYIGPVSWIHDSSLSISDTKAQFFELTSVDGRHVYASSTCTYGQNQGMGARMELCVTERPVPSTQSTLSIRGITHVAMPILALGGEMYTIEGNVHVELSPEERYVVSGILTKDYKAVWLESRSTGHIVSKLIEEGMLPPEKKEEMEEARRLLISEVEKRAAEDRRIEDEAQKIEESLRLEKENIHQKKISDLGEELGDCKGYAKDSISKSDIFVYGKELYLRKEYELAMSCFGIIASRGHTESMMYIGMMYEFGYGVEQNVEEARIWYKRTELKQRN